MQDKTILIAHAERDWKTLLNFWEAFWILRRNPPLIILSTEAEPVVPFAIVRRLFFGTRVVFVETITRINRPSLTGRNMYWLAYDFFFHMRSLEWHFPKRTYGGPLA